MGKCIQGLKEQPGRTLTTSVSALDTLQIKYLAQRGEGKNLMPQVGTPAPGYPGMGVQSVSLSNDGAFDIVTVSYHGFADQVAKHPSGGGGAGLVSRPIQLHPNYSQGPGTWGTVFGSGPSPNSFGRKLDDTGAFLEFGPLDCADGKEGRPNRSNADGADALEGVEAYLDPGAATYKYTRITRDRWAPFAVGLGFTVNPISALIPVPPLPDDRTWMLISCQEEITMITAGGIKAYSTTVEFQGSGHGGDNPLIYRKAANDINLDAISAV
tara:strand:+ start:52 stop:858 length:807 start_codon:yes stop_codon:yes gene_type:complete